MAKTEVRIEGIPELIRKLEEAAKVVGHEKVQDLTYEAMQMMTDRVQSNVNSINAVTGNLRRSPVTRKMRGSTAISAIDRKIAPHASLIEQGTSRMAAQPYFRPAWDNMRDTVKKHVEQGLKRLIEGATR